MPRLTLKKALKSKTQVKIAQELNIDQGWISKINKRHSPVYVHLDSNGAVCRLEYEVKVTKFVNRKPK